MEDEINKAFDKAEKIGVIGSPSSTNALSVDVLGTAIDKKLVGALCLFKHMQDGKEHFSLGQITEITLKNSWSEDPTMRSLIRQKGRVDPITEKQDTHTASMIVSSVFSKIDSTKMGPSMLGTVPSTGSPIKLMNNEVMDGLLGSYKDQLSYLGRAYGSDIMLPMWFKQFNKSTTGVGEAYHIGVFGKTGSGKSVLAKMIMLSYAKHPTMSIFVIDPQGELSGDFEKDAKLKAYVKDNLKRDVQVINLKHLVLTYKIDLFMKLLFYSKFFDKLAIYNEDNKIRTFNTIMPLLKAYKPWDYWKREAFNIVWNAFDNDTTLAQMYTGLEYRERTRSARNSADVEEFYTLWEGITNLFKFDSSGSKIQIKTIAEGITKDLDKGKMTIVDLSELNATENIMWNDDIKAVVIKDLIDRLKEQSEELYKQGKSLNTLVVIDEAHRLAPAQTDNEDLKAVRLSLVDAVRTTRKSGLGWMFISQTLSSLDVEILKQLRAYILGFGLGWGFELQTLRGIIGGNKEAIRLYQLFRDPQSSFGDKEYPFMMVGPLSPLSFASIPMFFNAVGYPDDFINLNK
ncbi:MAG: ATP-binding protein [Candidatus Marsarchaeota archaeon]|nr:ATP-binding protein [Candidatus Marsarchaeota archaeon]